MSSVISRDAAAAPAARTARGAASWLPWLLVALAVVAAALIRFRLLEMPLDRDEGEYAYMGRLLLDGTPPYARAYNMKFPGIYAVYALLLAVFGVRAASVHLGVMVASSVSTALVFLLGRRLAGPWIGAAAATVFALLAVSPALLGLAGNAEHFVLLPALAGVLVLLHDRAERLAWPAVVAGVLFGLACLVKQHGMLFGMFGVAYLLRARRIRETAGLLAGVVVPVTAVVVWLAAAGVFPRFWFWTVSYASRYAIQQSPLAATVTLGQNLAMMLPSCVGVAALAAIGFMVVACEPEVLGPTAGASRWTLILLTLASLAATCVGFYFRPQYFLLLAPVLAVLTAISAARIARWSRPWLGASGGATLATTVLGLVVVQSVWADRGVLFQYEPAAASRAIYYANPFPESIPIARYLHGRTRPGERIAVIGSEPQIYFYADRPAATGYIYAYPLMERHRFADGMQREMVREIEAANPRYFVYVHVPGSWLAQEASPRYLEEWFERYRRERLDQVALLDMRSNSLTVASWDQYARDRVPQSPLWLAIYRRRDDVSP